MHWSMEDVDWFMLILQLKLYAFVIIICHVSNGKVSIFFFTLNASMTCNPTQKVFYFSEFNILLSG